MSLTLYFHPLSSFCQKVLTALYENDTPFERHLVDFSNEAARVELQKIWPIGKIPVLRDNARERTIPESSIIIEYRAQSLATGCARRDNTTRTAWSKQRRYCVPRTA
jgi:glutathione S-transferase